MTFLTVASLIIPGYALLSPAIRDAFEGSMPGVKFNSLVQSTLEAKETLKKSSWLWNKFLGTTKEKEQELRSTFDTQKKALIAEISNTTEYKTLISSLTHTVLNKEIQDFKLLTTNQQLALSQTEFSQKLYESLVAVDESIAKQEQERNNLDFWTRRTVSGKLITLSLDGLKTLRNEILACWNKVFQTQLDLAPLRNTIDDAKKLAHQQQELKKLAQLNEHATQLSESFPLLNYRKFKTEQPIINQLRAKYSLANGDVIATPEKVEEEELTDLLFYCMQKVSQMEISFINMDAFNKAQAKHLATEILKSFNDKSLKFSLDNWFNNYERRLQRYINVQLQLIKGKHWQVKLPTALEIIKGSLSYLWNTRPVNAVNDFLRKWADAHAFIQATSFSTQNESSSLAILDFYNYGRHHEQISEVRSVFSSLLSPLLPLYHEYRDIALYERNAYSKSFRSIMPIIIVVAVIIFVAVLLGPLALPDLAFAAVFIPALFLGLAIANIYVSYKNEIYNNLREQYYGGPFEIPEFQVNSRMLSAFGNQIIANKVREFYIGAFKECELLEQEFSSKHELGVLSQADIDLRKANITRRSELTLEWYDIHSNKELNYKDAPRIVLDRLKKIGDQEYQQLQNVLEAEKEPIRKAVAAVVTDIKSTIITNNKKPVFEPAQELEATTIKATYRFGIFKPPSCLDVRARMENLVNFSEQINSAKV